MSNRGTKEHITELEKPVTFEQKCPIPWWKRFGMIGFAFFFIKGLGWIALFAITFIWGDDALDGIKTFFSNLF